MKQTNKQLLAKLLAGGKGSRCTTCLNIIFKVIKKKPCLKSK
jgi:hypothetical protein